MDTTIFTFGWENVVLADGLLMEKREYLGLVKLDISILKEIKEGAPEYLTEENDKEYFFWVVENMKNSFKEWDIPPLIVEFSNDQFYVNDGRHRLEMFRQMGMEKIDVVLWKIFEDLGHSPLLSSELPYNCPC